MAVDAGRFFFCCAICTSRSALRRYAHNLTPGLWRLAFCSPLSAITSRCIGSILAPEDEAGPTSACPALIQRLGWGYIAVLRRAIRTNDTHHRARTDATPGAGCSCGL